MTPARQAVTENRYRGYLAAWKGLEGGDGFIRSTYKELATHTGVERRSVGPALKKMEAMSLIEDLSVHTVNGTAFRVAAQTVH